MDSNKGREKWCMLRLGGGSKDKTVNIDRIMLRFRPIAPKPVVGGAGSGSTEDAKKSLLVRSKRRYTVRKNNTGNIRRKKTTMTATASSRVNGSKDEIVTLQLLPERTETDNDEDRGRRWCNYLEKRNEEKADCATWLKNEALDETLSDRRVLVETVVTVERVTETCNMMEYLSSGDADIARNLEKDTCPAFISDGLNRVEWLNEAYKRMVMGGWSESAAETVRVMVVLAMKDDNEIKVVSNLSSSFTCRVRVQYTWQKEKYSKMVPCDVWRLSEFGGFAWRLDVEAALSLGR